MDTADFIEKVLSIQGIVDCGSSVSRDNIVSHRIVGLNKNLAIIDCSEEDISEETVKGHLTVLGLDEYIPAFCPILSNESIRVESKEHLN